MPEALRALALPVYGGLLRPDEPFFVFLVGNEWTLREPSKRVWNDFPKQRRGDSTYYVD